MGVKIMNYAGTSSPICSETVPRKPRRNIDGLAVARLREVLDYDPHTGAFGWKVRLSPRSRLDRPAGKLTLDGYRRISIDGVSYLSSHLAWLHFYGKVPEDLLDHKNGHRADDRIENLREANHSENSRNIGVRQTSSTGLKGVSRFSKLGNRAKFRSTITVNGVRKFLGLFMTAEEAHAAYCRAAEEHHGQFAQLTPPQETTMKELPALQALRAELARKRSSLPTAAQPFASNLIVQIGNIHNEADLARLRPFMNVQMKRLAETSAR
jgi:hypothetical protein